MATAWTDTVKMEEPVKASSIEALRTAIRAKIVGRRKLGTFTPADATVKPGDVVKAAHTQELITQLNKVAPQGVSVAAGDIIKASTSRYCVQT